MWRRERDEVIKKEVFRGAIKINDHEHV